MKTQKRLEDNDLMPFGKHKGKKMKDVPADYLIWIYENLDWLAARYPRVDGYIHYNWNILELEVKEK